MSSSLVRDNRSVIPEAESPSGSAKKIPLLSSVLLHLMVIAAIIYQQSPVPAIMSGGMAASSPRQPAVPAVFTVLPVTGIQDSIISGPATTRASETRPLPVTAQGSLPVRAPGTGVSRPLPADRQRSSDRHSVNRKKYQSQEKATQHRSPLQRASEHQSSVLPAADSPHSPATLPVNTESHAADAHTNPRDSGDTSDSGAGAGRHSKAVVKALYRRVNYPARAKALGVEGRIKLRFDVTASGTVNNVQIIEEIPRGVFSGDIDQDIRRWRYEKGAAAENQQVTIIFSLSGRVAVEN